MTDSRPRAIHYSNHARIAADNGQVIAFHPHRACIVETADEAARVLGASGWRMWLYIRLPLLRPAQRAPLADEPKPERCSSPLR